MRESHGPRVSKVAAGISFDRIEFSTLRIAERGMRKRISCSAIFCVATVNGEPLILRKRRGPFQYRTGSSELTASSDVRKRALTNTSPSLRMSQVFKLDLGIDLSSRLLQPGQERLAGARKVSHPWVDKERCVQSGGSKCDGLLAAAVEAGRARDYSLLAEKTQPRDPRPASDRR